MKYQFYFLAAVLLACSACAEEKEKSAEQLIEQLRSDDFDQRSAAAAQLEKLGESARAVLERAAKDNDADVRSHAAKILGRLSRATLVLYVRDHENKPVGNIDAELFEQQRQQQIFGVEATPPKGTPIKLAADGTASIKLERTGSLAYQLKAPGFLANGGYAMLTAQPGDNRAVITLLRGGTIQGTVTGSDGKPLAEADVIVFSAAMLDPELIELQLLNMEQMGINGTSCRADQNGNWRQENIAEGVHICVAKAAGHKPAVSAFLRVREQQTTTAPAMTLPERKPGKVAATIMKTDGKPLTKTAVNTVLSLVLSDAQRKRLMQIQNLPLKTEEKTTDDKGAIEIEDVTPGKYQLVVSANDSTSNYLDTEIEVKSGETLRVEPKPRPKNGSVTGRLLTTDGKGIRDIQVQLMAERDLQTGGGIFPQAFIFNEPMEQGLSATTAYNGEYRFNSVPPGKYAAVFTLSHDPGAHQGYVFGLDVQPGQKVTAPDATLAKAPVESASSTCTGRLLSPAGKAVRNAEVLHYGSNGNSEATTSDENGDFTLAIHTKPGPDECILIRQAGYKSLLLEPPFLKNADYTLQKQDFGKLRVTVTDEGGKPLAGARVMPDGGASQTQMQMQMFDPEQGIPRQPAHRITDKKGQVRLSGLAAGKRKLAVVAYGFYLPTGSGAVEVAANEERDVTLVLRPGAAISGRVRLPEGTPSAPILVGLQPGPRYVLAKAGGEFAFDGVVPGEYSIAVSVSGLVQKELAKVTVPAYAVNFKADALAIDMLRTGGIVLDCGKPFAGFTAALTNSNDPGDAVDGRNLSHSSSVDGTGRAEFWNVPPGQYKVNVKSQHALYNPSADMTASAVGGPVEVTPLDAYAKLAALPALKVDLKQGAASAAGRIRLPEAFRSVFMNSYATLVVRLQSEHATAEVDLSDSLGTYSDTAAPLMVGKPPEGFTPHVAGAFSVTGLVAGSYKVLAAIKTYSISEDGDAEYPVSTQSKGKFKQIGAFTIKDGEKVDLGDLKLEPDATPSANPRADYKRMLLQPLDKPQEFEP